VRMTTLGLTATFLTVAGLVACSDELSKSDILKAVDATLGQKSCFNLADMGKPISWPLKLVEGGLLGGGATLPPFLGNMQRAGYVQVEHKLEHRKRSGGATFPLLC